MRYLLLILMLVMLTACVPEGDEKIVIIGPNQVPCEQGSPHPCFLVKESASEPWQVVDSTIMHLTPLDGYQYTVVVQERDRNVDERIPKVTFLVIDVLEKREVMGRIMWYYG